MFRRQRMGFLGVRVASRRAGSRIDLQNVPVATNVRFCGVVNADKRAEKVIWIEEPWRPNYRKT